VFYLSRFPSSSAFVLLTGKEKYFLTDGRYYEGAKKKLKGWQVILLGDKNRKVLDHLIEVLNKLGGRKLGFEEDRTTVSFYKKLKEGFKGKVEGFSGFLNQFRTAKTKGELKLIKTAVEKTDTVFSRLLEYLPEAENELDVRRFIIDRIFREGGSGESFPSIVAAGKNSAVPHHQTSRKKIPKNGVVLIDMGMVYEGYCSDFTRTVCIGKVSREFEKVYRIVEEAHLTAVEKVKAGVPVKEVDRAAREVIKKYGYGDYFLHSTGHGLGIEIHEPPRVSQQSEEVLVENSVITIEPGIYLPDKWGVRLENVVVVEKNGCKVLTGTPLDLIKL